MDKYISLTDVMAYPLRRGRCHENANQHFINGIEFVMEYVEDLPTADVAPVWHGYWRKVVGTRYCGIRKDGNPIYRESYSYYCSNCDRGIIVRERYFPRCGAKMDGGI